MLVKGDPTGRVIHCSLKCSAQGITGLMQGADVIGVVGPGPRAFDHEAAREEIANDRELVLDEFHGMAPGEITEMYGK